MRTRNKQRVRPPGFTFIELLVILVVLAALLSFLGPQVCRTNATGKSAQCLSNLQRLAAGWQMYAIDYADRILPIVHGGEASGPNSPFGLASGWLDWSFTTDNTNINFLTDPKYSLIAGYVGKHAELFRCPADNYISSAQRSRGWLRRVRTYSANVNLGSGNAQSGPWDPLYKQIRKTSEFMYPAPGENYVFLEEHPDSINDQAFFAPTRTGWYDNPVTHHSGAGAFSFADGHAEMRKWTGSLLRLRGVGYLFTSIQATAGDPDIHWVSYRAGRISTNSY